jgi:L-rhamnose mutarotase
MSTSLTNSSKEACSFIVSEFERAREVQRSDFNDAETAFKRYFPVDFGKFTKDELDIFKEEGRTPIQIDIAPYKVDTLVGSIVSDLPDVSWVPVKGDKNILTEAVAFKYYSDKDMYNYDDTFNKVIRNGFVHAGDMVIVEDWKYGEPGIRFDSILNGFIVWDPYWMTDDDRDAEVYWRYAHMNPVKLKTKYGNIYGELEKAIEDYKKDRVRFINNPTEEKKDYRLGKVGDEFQVIEKHWLKEIRTKRLMGTRYDNDRAWIPFPINKDREYLNAFAEANNIDWSSVQETIYNDRIEYYSVVVRELNICVIEEKKSPIQVNGLSAHHFTARRYMGRNMGIMKSIADIEDMIIKRENLATDRLSMASNGGLINENLFQTEKKWKEFSKNKNRVGKYTRVPLDDVKNVVAQVVDNTMNFDLEKQIERALHEYMPLVSRVSEALSSMSDSNEPGILFERKFQTNMIANTLLNKNIRQFLNNVCESYFYQYQITYDGPPVQVNQRGGNGTAVTLNKMVGGVKYNWVKDTPRCRVVMTENTKSATYQMRWRSIWAEMLNAIDLQKAGRAAVPYYLMTLKNLFDTIEMREEDKDAKKLFDNMVDMISRLNAVAEATKLQTEIGGSTLQSAQIDVQLQNIMQQMQAMQQPVQPISHEQIESTPVNYDINPQQPAEAEPVVATPPASTGAMI